MTTPDKPDDQSDDTMIRLVSLVLGLKPYILLEFNPEKAGDDATLTVTMQHGGGIVDESEAIEGLLHALGCYVASGHLLSDEHEAVFSEILIALEVNREAKEAAATKTSQDGGDA